MRSERAPLGNLLELAALAVFADPVPRKAFAVHGNVNAGRQHLHERERASEIEEAVGAAEGVGDHRAGEHDRFPGNGASHRGGRLRHRVSAVGDDYAILVGLKAVLHDKGAIGVGHFETIDHHDRADGHLDARTSQPEHFRDVSVLKKELAGAFVIFLIEGAAGDEDSDGHDKSARCEAKLAFWWARCNPGRKAFPIPGAPSYLRRVCSWRDIRA